MEPVHIIGAIFIAYFVVKEVFVIVKARNEKVSEKIDEIHAFVSEHKKSVKKINEMISYLENYHKRLENHFDVLISQTDDLWDWHNKEDSDGVKIWYVRSSLEASIKDLVSTLETQRIIMRSILHKLDLSSIKK
jgi:predicted nuclease with TOPRIM domain